MHQSGLTKFETAKTNRTWTSVDEVADLIVPSDLQIAFEDNKKTSNTWL